MNKQSTDRKKYFAKFISERFVFRIHKELLRLNSINIKFLFLKKAKDFKSHLTKEDIQITNTHKKMLNIIN